MTTFSTSGSSLITHPFSVFAVTVRTVSYPRHPQLSKHYPGKRGLAPGQEKLFFLFRLRPPSSCIWYRHTCDAGNRGLSSEIRDTMHSNKESRMTKWMGMALVGLMSVGILQARAETTVTLPSGAGEYFTVQGATSNALLRVNADSVLTGTNVALGTTGTNIIIRLNNTGIGYLYTDNGKLSMNLGSNTITYGGAAVVIGHNHYLYNAPFAGIWGGETNRVSHGSSKGSPLSPYESSDPPTPRILPKPRLANQARFTQRLPVPPCVSF